MTSCQSNERLRKHQHPTEHKTAPANGDQRTMITQHEDDTRGIYLRGTLRRHDRTPGAAKSRDGPDGPSRVLLQELSRIGLVY
jgi:hypothetical protein